MTVPTTVTRHSATRYRANLPVKVPFELLLRYCFGMVFSVDQTGKLISRVKIMICQCIRFGHLVKTASIELE